MENEVEQMRPCPFAHPSADDKRPPYPKERYIKLIEYWCVICPVCGASTGYDRKKADAISGSVLIWIVVVALIGILAFGYLHWFVTVPKVWVSLLVVSPTEGVAVPVPKTVRPPNVPIKDNERLSIFKLFYPLFSKQQFKIRSGRLVSTLLQPRFVKTNLRLAHN